jgi:hypothetical protein
MSAAMSLLLFITSNAAALYPVSSSRYLIGFLLVIPAVLWPLWNSATHLHRGRGPIYRISPDKSGLSVINRAPTTIICTATLLFVAATFLVGTIITFTQIPTAQAAAQSQQALTRDLLKIGATRIYTDYWTCNRIIFESRERILCATLNPQLGQGYDRYKPYRYALRATPHPTFLFPLDSPLLPLFEHKHIGDTSYHRFVFDGYVVYQYVGTT